MKILYVAEATAYGGRNGRVTSSDDRLDVQVVPPPELGGTEDEGTNPEQMFAGGYAACFMSAMSLVAHRMKVDVTDATVTAKVSLGKVPEEVSFHLAAELVVHVPNATREEAQALIERSHQVCPYSNATRGNIVVDVKVADA